MTGTNVFLDTNAFIYFFEGRSKITDLVIRVPTIYYSVISEIELLSALQLTEAESKQITEFLTLCIRIELTTEVTTRSIRLRRAYRLKVPDAIIAASALDINAPLVSADTDFRRVIELDLITDIVT